MTRADAVTFYVMSDIPMEDSELGDLASQVRSLPSTADFAVHLGDVRDAARTLCDAADLDEVRDALSGSSVPLLVLPGDEDYAACPEPFDALEDWRDRFADLGDDWATESALAADDADDVVVFDRQARRKENFGFLLRRDVLFVGLNLAGRYARDETAWNELDEDNVSWTRELLKKHGARIRALVLFGHARPGPRQYDRYFRYFRDDLEPRDVPVFYVHGDALEDEPILPPYRPYEQSEGDANVMALEVQRGGRALPLKVTVSRTPSGRPQFLIDRRTNESS